MKAPLLTVRTPSEVSYWILIYEQEGYGNFEMSISEDGLIILWGQKL